MKRIVAWLWAIVSIATVQVFAQSTTLDNPIPFDPSVRVGVLENGMKYYLKKNVKPENRAELRLAVAAGSIQEDEDQLGLAHFVEHMAFNGSANFTKNELVDYLESVGTRFGPDLNAYTSFDETVYMLQVRTDDAEQLGKGLLVLEDWSHAIAFDDEEIDKERGVVISEWRSRLSAGQRMQQEYFPKLFYNSRYADRLPIGDPAIVENASYETVRRFYRDWYRPDLMAVCIVGDIDLDEMEAEVKRRFADVPVNPMPRAKEHYSVPAHDETLTSILSDPEATSTDVRIIYKHKFDKPSNVADYRETLLHSLYNGMLNERLYEVNNTADPPFVFSYTGYGQSVGDLGTYTSFARVPETGIIRGFETLLTENERVRRYGFVASELDRQKVELMERAERAVREQDKTESSRYVSDCVYHFLEGSPMPSESQTLDLYKALLPGISVAEINALAEKWITDKNRVIIVTAPEKEGVILPTEAELLDIIARVSKSDLEPYEDNVSDLPLFSAELLPVGIVEMPDTNLGIHSFKLANGVQVQYKQTDFKNDEILVAGYSWGGNSLFPDEYYPSAGAIGSVIRESGVSEFDAPQLGKKLTGKTVNISPFIGERLEGFYGNCSPKDFETLFQLIYLYATDPRMEEDAVQAYLKKQSAILENLMSNPNVYFNDVVNNIRYENHPRRGIPTTDDLKKVSLAQIREIYRDRFSDLSDFTFFFTGSFEPSQLKSLAATYLGNLPAAEREESWKDVGVHTPYGEIDSTLYRGEAPKSNVRIIYHGDFDWNPTERYALRSLTDYARIKLRESLREDMGGVYGVSIYSSDQKEPRPEYSIQISFNSDPPRTQELVDAAYEVILEIQHGEVTPHDVDKVRELQKQARVKDLKENRFWQNAMIESWTDGVPLDELTMEHLDNQLMKLTPELIQSAARKYFGSDKIEVVMYPEQSTTE